MSNSQNQSQNQEHSKVTGQFHSMKGSVVEAVGDATGAPSWSQSGKEEHSRGEAEYTAAQAEGYAEGLSGRVGGYKDSVVGAVCGDKDQTDERKCTEGEGSGSDRIE